jgi:predicted nucleic acid-binding protein
MSPAERLGVTCGQWGIQPAASGLVHRAGELAEGLGLRGYDAVHPAAAETLRYESLVLVAGDRALCRAAEALGIPVART